MRSLAVIALLYSSAAAEPARTTVDKLVRTAVATVDAKLLADHAVINIYGSDESDLVAVSAIRTHGSGGKITRKIDPRGVTIIADEAAGAAWFVAPYTLDIVDPPMDVSEVHSKERVAGLVLRTGGTWRIAGLLYARTMPDKELMDPANLSTATDAMPAAAQLGGDDDAVGREIRGWFATGLAKAAAPGIEVLAAGTQASELATTSAASLKLAATWDALKLVPGRLHASLFGDGKLAFVTTTVYLPRKTGPGAVRMGLAIVAIKTTAGWRWVSLQFSA